MPPGTEVEITCYTDPLCSWSWAFEAVRRRLRYELGDRVAWRDVLGGLLPDWQSYEDPLHSVSRPAQMGPLWYEVRHRTGMPLDDRIWIEDPPASSFPASVAVKAAARQGPDAGGACLRRLREAALVERRNVARPEVLRELFDELAAGDPGLDPERFRRDLAGEEALADFREDLKDARYRRVGRFPTFILRGPGGRALLVVGYRPYAAFREALAEAAPGVEPSRTAADSLEYARRWRSIAAAEVAEALGRPPGDAAEVARALDRAVAAGELSRRGELYLSADPSPAE